MKRKLLLLIGTLFLSALAALGQRIEIKGVVYDDQKEPAIGATIRLKSDSKVGTQSGIDGAFTIRAREGELLVISYIGYKTVEVKAKQGMKVYLQSDAELLSEVVAMGYGSGRAISTTTASIVKVDSKDLESKPVSNVFEGLQGKVAGLSVSTSSGEPGELATINLHGYGSLGLSSTPMYILDGVPVGQGTIMGLNPNDYESVQIFKDASATAIYGSRASNGVIFITTKRGEAGQRATVTLNAQYGVSNLADRTFYNSMMSADELAKFWVETGIRSQKAVDQLRKAFPHDTNWTDFFFRKNAPTVNLNVSVSGGSQNTTYYVSGQHFYQEGLFAGRSLYTKDNLRANLQTKVNDWLSFYLNNGIYYDNSISTQSGWSNYSDGGLFYWISPFYTPYKENGEPYYDERIPGANIYSPYYVADMYKEEYGTFEYLGNLGVTIRPLEGLTLRSNIGLDFSNYYGNTVKDPRAMWSPGNGSRSDKYSRGIDWTFTNTAEYHFNLADTHDFTLLAGHEFNRYDGNSFSASGSGLKDYRLMHLGKVTDKEKRSIGSSFGQYAYLSFFGRLSYGLLDRYFIDLSVRNDASSKFPPKHRNALFWSAGIKWNAKKEAFLADVSWLNRLDVKISTGTAGNSAGLGSYDFFASAGVSNPYRGEPSRVIISPGNPALTWEKQQKTTLGFDVRLFDLLGINLELYDRRTTDMVMDVPYPYTTGITTNTQNVGTYQNRGFDFRVDVDVWKGRRGNYASVYGNINYNQDKVLELFQGLDTWVMTNYMLAYQVGKPAMFLMPIFKQVNPETGDPEWYNPGEDVGKLNKDDNNITTGYDFNEEALQQNTGVPYRTPCRGGFGLNAYYEGFFLSADFSFFLGKHMVNNDNFFALNPKKFPNRNTSKNSVNFWKKPGDRTIMPDMTRYEATMQFDTRLLEDASFLRLKSLSVGYDLPRRFLEQQTFFKGVKLGLTGRNLLTFTKYSGSDPEADTNLAYGMNPATMQILGSVEIKF